MQSEATLTGLWGPAGDVPLVDIGGHLRFTPQLKRRRADGSIIRQRVVVHADIAERLTVDLNGAVDASFAAAEAAGEDEPVYLRADGYVNRPKRSSKSRTPSKHARGLAVDVFATEADVPPPGGVWTPDAQLPDAFYDHLEAAGLTLGKYFRRTDTPHIEDNRPPDWVRPEPVSWAAIIAWAEHVGQMLHFTPLGPRHDDGPADRRIRTQATRTWQTQLAQAGYLVGVDGAFGPQTHAATKAWQVDQRMPASGMVGGVDWRRLVLKST